eukprot:327276-Rhodomonas_salina.3
MDSRSPTSDNTLSPVDELYSKFVNVFLSGVNLERFLVYACNTPMTDNSDPISAMVVAMLSSPIHISLSSTGVHSFKSTLVPVLPYSLLDQEQCDFIRWLLSRTNKTIPVSISSDAHGGFTMKIQQSNTHVFVSKDEVLKQLSACIHKSNGYGDSIMKDHIMSILTQRISTMAMIPHDKTDS